MSRLSNLTTLKIGIFKSWNTYWFDKQYYAVLLFNDLRIRDYLSGIFYKLKVVSDYFYFYRFLNKTDIITTNLIFFSNLRFKSITLRNVYSLGVSYVFFYQKRYWKHFLYYTKLLRKFYTYTTITHQKQRIATYHLTYLIPSILLKGSISTYIFNKNKTDVAHNNLRCNTLIQDNKDYVSVTTMYNLTNTITNYFTLNKWIVLSNNSTLSSTGLSYLWYYKNLICKYQLSLVHLLKYVMYFVSTLSGSIYATINMLSGIVKAIDVDIPLTLTYKGISLDGYIYMNYRDHSNLMINIDRRYITKSLFNALRSNIENTVSLFNQNRVYFNFSIFFKKNPFIVSAKLITETLVYLLQSGKKIVPSFFFIRNWQASLYKGKRSLEHIYFQYAAKRTNLNYLFYYASKRFPLIGIRIECSGTYKKGRMARIYFYSSWVKDDVLTGRMPNSTMIADIDYYQYFAITKSSSIGVKTWIFLETHLYNNNNKYISIVY